MMWGYGWGWIMGLGMMLFWAALIAFAIWAILKFSWGTTHSANRILEERFARGEISEEEFQKRAALLSR